VEVVSKTIQIKDSLYDLSRARGLYDGLRFVVRMRPEMYRILDEHPPDGKVGSRQASFEQLDAFSTYLHETLHWWQHIGSTTGLMLSFTCPAKSHVNHERLKELLARIGPHKSLRTFDALHPHQGGQTLNIVLNNWHDLEFNWRLLINPQSVYSIVSSPYFDCVGHSLSIGLANTLLLVSSTFDREFAFIPDIRRWEAGFAELRNSKAEGFYFGSPIKLPPIGVLHIFEGQARFSQIQYLHNATGGRLDWQYFKQRGMLDGVYVEAFKLFLSLTETDWPDSFWNNCSLPDDTRSYNKAGAVERRVRPRPAAVFWLYLDNRHCLAP
jgi:hypothetical protein